MIKPAEVSAVLVTRGDVSMDPITDSLTDAGFTDIVVWDNSQHEDVGIYGRYAAIKKAKNTVIVTQDDDVIVSCWDEILAAYEPGVLTVNYAEPWDIPWVACGSVFDCELPGVAFQRYLNVYPRDRMFTHLVCDAVFGLLSERVKVIDHGHVDLPHGFADGRVSTSPGWYTGPRLEVAQRCAALKVAA